MDKFITYNSTSELHRELTNIVLLCMEDNNSYYYCYSGEEFGDCNLCKLIDFLFDIEKKNLMDGLSPRSFLAKNHNNRSKLEEFSLKILPFFEKMKEDFPPALDFFQKNYHWSSRDRVSGKFYDISLEEAIENEILSAECSDLKIDLNIKEKEEKEKLNDKN